MNKHTPGPWTYAGNTSSTATVTAPRALVDPDMVTRHGAPDTPEAVAICRGPSETRKANARLIAAAPDLLATLEWAARVINDFEEEPEDNPLLVEILKVIAKAKGE